MPKKSKAIPEESPPVMAALTTAQKEAMLRSLCMDSRFVVFSRQLQEQRETAIQDLCNDDVVGNHTKLAAAVGEVRTYTAILSLITANTPEASVHLL